MIESLYALLAKIGYPEPLHPAITHIPMGMVIGCFIFGLLAWKRNNPNLQRTSLHCSILALVFIFPTIILGLMDWDHRYGAEFFALIIIKMVLATVLTGLLAYSIWQSKHGADPKKMCIIYSFCLLCAVGLGLSGGELVYGG